MSEMRVREYGVVKSTAGCIATVLGFRNCFLGQLVKFGYGTEGVIMGFDENEAMILVVKENEPIQPGARVTATMEPFNMPVGEEFVGRIVDPLGVGMDGLAPIRPKNFIPYFNDAPGIMDREGLSNTLETGIKLIDTMLPIGFGQRMLILGDKMTGKTTIGTDIIINQKGKTNPAGDQVICIYCAIGKARAQLARVVDLFKDRGCFDYTLICAALANASPGLQYLAVYAACSLGEYFMNKGRFVFVFFDDFTKHAWAYRELSLLMQVPPGRDSYPGDIFYLHSRMIERAGQLNKRLGHGAMVFIPAVELLEGDLTAYVPTNLVSMTDGQVFLSMPLFNEGFRPAVDVGLSVSRVGSRVQWKAMKSVAKSLRIEFLQFKEVLRVSKLQTGGQSDEMRDKLSSGKVLQALLTQPAAHPVSQEQQVIMFLSKGEGILNSLDKDQVQLMQKELVEHFQKKDAQLFDDLRAKKDLDDDLKQRIVRIMKEFVAEIKERTKVEDDDFEIG